MVKKNKNRGKCTAHEQLRYVYISKPNMSIYSAVRDLILPHGYVFIKIEKNGDFLLIPTDNPEGYKLSICKGSTKISACGLLSELNVRQRVRIRCDKQSDGSIICKASECV